MLVVEVACSQKRPFDCCLPNNSIVGSTLFDVEFPSYCQHAVEMLACSDGKDMMVNIEVGGKVVVSEEKCGGADAVIGCHGGKPLKVQSVAVDPGVPAIWCQTRQT